MSGSQPDRDSNNGSSPSTPSDPSKTNDGRTPEWYYRNGGRPQSGTSKNIAKDPNAGPDVNTDEMIGKTVTVGNTRSTVRGYVKCENKRLYAMESQLPVQGYDSRCPVCTKIHVPLPERHGYYATVESIREAMANEKAQQERAKGPLPIRDLPIEKTKLPPLDRPLTGKNKGIEGDSNSCHIDATIFCMFAYNNAFDSLLYTPVDDRLSKLQSLLRDNIVHLLRRSDSGSVTRDTMFRLREELAKVTNDKSFLEEEKDPTDFLRVFETHFRYTPIHTVRRDQPPAKDFSNVTSNIVWEMFDANPHARLWTSISSIFRNSLSEIPAKLASIPSSLILIAPRHKRSERSYPYIIPDQEIILDNNLLQVVCQNCKRTNHSTGRPTDFYSCDKCCQITRLAPDDAQIECLCGNCLKTFHDQDRKSEWMSHKVKKIEMENHRLSLYAVLCIELAHYVAFVKCHGRQQKDEWVFFDSMSDRVNQDKNIPCVSRLPNFDLWLTECKKSPDDFFRKLDDRRRRPGAMSQKFDEDEMRMLRLFRDGAFFFYERPNINYS